MLYDVLNSYRNYLIINKKYTPATARTYYNRLAFLLQEQNLNLSAENIDINKILDNLSKIKYKSYFSQSKNAFFHFCSFLNISLTNDVLEQIETLKQATKKKYRRLEKLNFKEINKKINSLSKENKNQKLKLSYQTMIATGLRVSELAGIALENTLSLDDEISFSFIGKGGELETVSIIKNEYPILFDDLKTFISNVKPKKKIFYSAVHLQTNAKKLGFACHDLRRACAKLEYKKNHSKERVKNKLRHKSKKNTNIYLRSKVKI